MKSSGWKTHCLVVGCWLLTAGPSWAQPEPPPPTPAPYETAPAPYPPPGQYQQAPPPPQQLMPMAPPGVMPLAEMPEFRAGKRRRLAGILVTSIGSGVSLVTTSLGLLVRTTCSTYGGCTTNDAGDGLIVGGLIGLGVSLAVGIPLWVSGQRQVREARACWSAQFASSLDVAPTRGGALVGSRWRF